MRRKYATILTAIIFILGILGFFATAYILKYYPDFMYIWCLSSWVITLATAIANACIFKATDPSLTYFKASATAQEIGECWDLYSEREFFALIPRQDGSLRVTSVRLNNMTITYVDSSYRDYVFYSDKAGNVYCDTHINTVGHNLWAYLEDAQAEVCRRNPRTVTVEDLTDE